MYNSESCIRGQQLPFTCTYIAVLSHICKFNIILYIVVCYFCWSAGSSCNKTCYGCQFAAATEAATPATTCVYSFAQASARNVSIQADINASHQTWSVRNREPATGACRNATSSTTKVVYQLHYHIRHHVITIHGTYDRASITRHHHFIATIYSYIVARRFLSKILCTTDDYVSCYYQSSATRVRILNIYVYSSWLCS